MKTYEYDYDTIPEYLISHNDQRTLMNDRGKDGWKLVSVTAIQISSNFKSIHYYWERPTTI